MQYRRPLGGGPSSKRWPRCESHRPHRTSIRIIPWLVSIFLTMGEFSTGSQNDGQPEPESNFSVLAKSGASHTRQW
jgi:hypothetical protein